MAGDQSFDVVSDFDEQELRNALDQVRREEQGPPTDRAATGPDGRECQEDHETDQGRIPEGEVTDPG